MKFEMGGEGPFDNLFDAMDEARRLDAAEKTSKLDPEFAREEAKRLAGRQEEILKKAKYLTGDCVRVEIEDICVDNYHGGYEIRTFNHPIQGIGPGQIFLFQDGGFFTFPDILGVSRCNGLHIDIHTDQTTQGQAEKIDESSKDYLFLGTRYYFDRKGRYAKVAALPEAIRDDRPDIDPVFAKETNPLYFKLVRSEMTPGDFELAGAALQILEDKLGRAQELASSSLTIISAE